VFLVIEIRQPAGLLVRVPGLLRFLLVRIHLPVVPLPAKIPALIHPLPGLLPAKALKLVCLPEGLPPAKAPELIHLPVFLQVNPPKLVQPLVCLQMKMLRLRPFLLVRIHPLVVGLATRSPRIL